MAVEKTTQMSKRQSNLLAQMDPVTVKAAKEGQKKVLQGSQVKLLVRYELGVLIDKVLQTGNGKGGADRKRVENQLYLVAQFWGLLPADADDKDRRRQMQTMYDLRNVSTAFDRAFIQAQQEEPMANGALLTWSHFKALQKTDPKGQLKLLKKVRRSSMSAQELQLEIAGTGTSTVKRQGGRKPTLPKTSAGIVQKLKTSVQSSTNYLALAADPLQGQFLELSESDIDEAFVESVQETAVTLDSALKQLSESKKQLKKVLTRSTRVLERKQVPDDSATLATAAKRETGSTETAPIKRRSRRRKAD